MSSDSPAPFDLKALRECIEGLTRSVVSEFDQRTLCPEALVHYHFVLNALDQARIHVEAARLANER